MGTWHSRGAQLPQTASANYNRRNTASDFAQNSRDAPTVKIDDFKLLIEAGNPIIAMETPDETRAYRLVREVADADRRPLVRGR